VQPALVGLQHLLVFLEELSIRCPLGIVHYFVRLRVARASSSRLRVQKGRRVHAAVDAPELLWVPFMLSLDGGFVREFAGN